MPVTASHIKVQYRYLWLDQRCLTEQYFRVTGAAFLTATMLGVLEALWANTQDSFRSVFPDEGGFQAVSLYGEEVGGGGGYAEYAIPVEEQGGLRPVAVGLEAVTGALAGGFRQTVGTKLTRPGQKRMPGLVEVDISGNILTDGEEYITYLTAWAETLSTPRLLGAPVATGELMPAIGGSRVDGVPTVFQDVVGYVINPYVTTQVSRKYGHGT